MKTKRKAKAKKPLECWAVVGRIVKEADFGFNKTAAHEEVKYLNSTSWTATHGPYRVVLMREVRR